MSFLFSGHDLEQHFRITTKQRHVYVCCVGRPKEDKSVREREQKAKTICLQHQIYINMYAYHKLNDCKHRFNMKLPLGIRWKPNGNASLFSHESICLLCLVSLVLPLWHGMAQITENIGSIVVVFGCRCCCCRCYSNSHRYQNETRAERRARVNSSSNKKNGKKYRVHGGEYQLPLRCNAAGFRFFPLHSISMCFSFALIFRYRIFLLLFVRFAFKLRHFHSTFDCRTTISYQRTRQR